jgi:predicted signal transduction protein with EAL and GGDEF domain
MTRQAFERQATALLAAMSPAQAHCILYLDIDRLHVINETFGMHVGDDVIVTVAEAWPRLCRAAPCRRAFPGIVWRRWCPTWAWKRLPAWPSHTCRRGRHRAARRPRFIRGIRSLGVAPVGKSDNALAHALATAEIACKAAKDRGRNRVEIFQDSDHSIIRRHTDILVVGKLRDALENDSFRLDAQPILPLRGNYGRPRFELLIRMLGDRGEIIPPGSFCPRRSDTN